MNSSMWRRRGQVLALSAAWVAFPSVASAQSFQEDLPELPSEPEHEEEAPQPAETGPRLPSYMVEEPFVPPSLPDVEPDAEPGRPHPRRSPYRRGDILEPPPPPPPPPHRAPRNSLWLGARLGMIAPFGKLEYDYPDGFGGPDWADVAGPGITSELDIGGRFARHYIVYGFWERGFLGIGRDEAFLGKGWAQRRARTDLLGAGFRWTSHPDETGFVIDFGLGFRTFRADWQDDVSLHLVSPIEVRLGLGVDVRVSRGFSLSPMMQISNGAFMTMSLEQPGESTRGLLRYEAPHGTFGLAIGGHFDLMPNP